MLSLLILHKIRCWKIFFWPPPIWDWVLNRDLGTDWGRKVVSWSEKKTCQYDDYEGRRKAFSTGTIFPRIVHHVTQIEIKRI